MKSMTPRKRLGILICAAMLAVFMVPAFSLAAQSVSDKAEQITGPQTPTVTMRDWKNSTIDERYSFLAGFSTLLELERGWQGDTPLPIKQSLIGSWAKGLSNVSIRQMDAAVNEYVHSSGADMNRLVVDYLWFTFVQPKIGKAASNVSQK
ncbi:hypothetical protein LJC23_05200 [Desulfovibrio sp. OttesenSCG-928-I05]|nr:hypothetical protein [Desulfovibrio sp. OttesenSCG-928-I05]